MVAKPDMLISLRSTFLFGQRISAYHVIDYARPVFKHVYEQVVVPPVRALELNPSEDTNIYNIVAAMSNYRYLYGITGTIPTRQIEAIQKLTRMAIIETNSIRLHRSHHCNQHKLSPLMHCVSGNTSSHGSYNVFVI
jgi:hypothetical protein